MAAADVAMDPATEQAAAALPRPREAIDRARRLYADARTLERLCPSEQGKEIAREVALMAMDLLVEARVESAA